MSVDPALIRAYRQAEYVVFGEIELVFRIGEASPELDELLDGELATTAAFISPGNRRGRRQSESDNANAFLEMNLLLKESSYGRIAGEGRDPEGKWPPEASLLLVGISRMEAEKLGRALAQNAIVFIEKGKAAELVVLQE